MSLRIAAVDQGTTSTRALVFTDSGAEVVFSRTHATTYPHPGWVEQDAHELLGNVRAAIAVAGKVDAIGIANQGESCLAWDSETGEPLTPVIVWQDGRTAADLGQIDVATQTEIAARSGLPADPYFSASKLGWIVRNCEAARAALSAGRLRLGTTDAFFLDRLTGNFVTDRATASRTSLMNLTTGAWDETLCDVFGVPRESLPEIVANTHSFGTVGNVPISASIVDQQAALFGHGCRARGEAKITFGTGAFALAVSGHEAVDPNDAGGLLPTVAWDLGDDPVYALDGGVYDVGSAIDWAVRAGLGTAVSSFADFEAPSAISRGLAFVPAFSGLAAPHWDRTAAPVLIGLQPSTSQQDIRQALLEGIAFATASVIEAMAKALPLSGPISIDGGVSGSPYFVRFLASLLERPVVVRGLSEQTSLGVAMLAATGIGQVLSTPAAKGDTQYEPALEITVEQRALHAEAVSRSRNWRR